MPGAAVGLMNAQHSPYATTIEWVVVTVKGECVRSTREPQGIGSRLSGRRSTVLLSVLAWGLSFGIGAGVAQTPPLTVLPAGREDPWQSDCRTGADRTDAFIRVRMLSGDLALEPKVVPATIEWPAQFPPWGPASMAFLSGDVNGDGKTDLLIGHPQSDELAIAVATGEFAFTVRTIEKGYSGLDYAKAVVVAARPGECARFMIPPRAVGEQYRMVSWRTLHHLPEEPLGEIRRTFSALRLSIVTGLVAGRYGVVERDGHGQNPHAWIYIPDHGWSASPALLPFRSGSKYLGIGFEPSHRDRQAFFYRIEPRALCVNSEAIPYGCLAAIFDPVRNTKVLFGDFDGNGYSDLLTVQRGAAGRGTWLTLGEEFAPISRPLKGFSEAVADSSLIGTGDYDGDGSDEALVLNGDRLAVVQLVTPRKEWGDFSLRVGDRKYPFDSGGRHTVVLPAGGFAEIEVSSEKSLVKPAAAILTAESPGKVSVGIHYEPQDRPDDGRPLSLVRQESGPFSCIGFNPGYSVSSLSLRWGRTEACPKGYAVVETDDGTWGLTCCPMPVDLFDGPSVSALPNGLCPPNTVVVASAPLSVTDIRLSAASLICAPIDTRRYRLLPPTPGRYWGEGSNLGSRHRAYTRSGMPAGIREAVGRGGWSGADLDGCIGDPVGALHVGGFSKQCENMYFSRVVPIRAGAESPPPPPYPIRNCTSPPDPFNPLVGCPTG